MTSALALLVMVGVVRQAGSDAASSAELTEAWLKVCASHATDYEIYPAGKPEDKLELLPQPVFRHSQPVRGDDIGAVWIWVQKDGRPAVVGTVFAYSGGAGGGGYRWVAHELHSLADVPLTADWRGRRQWAPAKPGIEWKPIPDAPEPSETGTARLRQMRTLARRFRAHSVDSQRGRWELRLIAKPVHAYELNDPDSTLGGAWFTFCQGTDPEIFLGLEARKSRDGYRWHYGCAAFSDYGLYVRLDEVEVWSIPTATPSRTGPHWWHGQVERTKLREDDPR